MTQLQFDARIADDLIAATRHILRRTEFEVVLYGSYARGDNADDSDVDFAIFVSIPNEELMQKDKLFSELESQLSLKYDVTVSLFLKEKRVFQQYLSVLPFYQNIQREGVRLYAGR